VAHAKSGHFLSSLFESWESECLQMSVYVMLTAFLFQRGFSVSKDPDDPADQDDDPALKQAHAEAPCPVRVGLQRPIPTRWGSPSVSFFLRYTAEAENAEALMHASQQSPSPSTWLAPRYESLQKWRSEFLSTAVIVVLSIFLRFKGSPEKKPVAAPHAETGA
jgi:hypothetical protein